MGGRQKVIGLLVIVILAAYFGAYFLISRNNVVARSASYSDWRETTIIETNHFLYSEDNERLNSILKTFFHPAYKIDELVLKNDYRESQRRTIYEEPRK